MAETTKSIFDTEEFKKYKERWNDRRLILSRRKSYYDGSIYRASIFSKQNQALLGTNAYGLYKHMRPLYLPLSRSVDIDAGIIPGEWAFPDDLPNAQALSDARDLLFDMSSWNTEGVLFVHYGAQYGLTGLKVCDVQTKEEKKVKIEPIDPMTFMMIPKAVIIEEERTDDQGKKYQYGEVITAETVRTFRNGQPFAFDDPYYLEDEASDVWDNPLGFVPVVESEHMKTGEKYGEATYSKAIPMLAELNGLASYLADIVKKHAEPQWAAFGVEPSDLVKSGNNVWFFPVTGADAKPLVAQVDVSGILEFIREIRDQVHASLPELSFDDLRKKDQIATATLELQLMELIIKIKRCRPNYDDALSRALQLAGQAAEKIGVSELTVLNEQELEFDQTRQILPIDKKTEMELEMQAIELEQMRSSANKKEGVPNG